MISLSLLYPYIVPLLGEFIFAPYNVSKEDIEKYSEIIFSTYIEKDNYEACAFAFQYLIDAQGTLSNFSINTIIEKHDCILTLMALIYCRKNDMQAEIKMLEQYAVDLVNANEIDEQWVFVYECLSKELLQDDWKSLKENNVSFLKKQYSI